MHVIKLPSGNIEIKWGMYAQRLYCERYNIPDAIEFFEQFQDSRNIQKLVPQLLLIGAEYAALKSNKPQSYTIVDACEWFDEGGELSEDGEIMKAFIYIISGHKVNLSESILKPDDEKKN